MKFCSDAMLDHSKAAEAEFNRQRKLFIQNVPPVTHQDVREYLGNLVPADIVISKRFQHVIITLKNSCDVDTALSTLQGRSLAGRPVTLELYPRRMMLYVCGIPSHYNHDMFVTFLMQYGGVETAFLSYTPEGHSRGYGFVEFAHNRANLDQVQKKINGSVLAGSVLYCDLVSDTIRSYKDTHSRVFYCQNRADVGSVLSLIKDCPVNVSAIIKDLYNLLRSSPLSTRMPGGSTLYIVECPSGEVADLHWTRYLSLPPIARAALQIHFAMPAFTPIEVFSVIFDTKVRYPSLDDKTETRVILMQLFPDQPELILSIESLLEQMRSQIKGQQLTVNFIMNLVKIMGLDQTPQASASSSDMIPPIFDKRMPPPGYDSHTGTSQLSRGPVTRSRAVGEHSKLISLECEKRHQILQQHQHAGIISLCPSSDCYDPEVSFHHVNRYNDENVQPPAANSRNAMTTDPTCNAVCANDESLSVLMGEHALLNSLSGPITRQRRRTIEKVLTPYRKTPGAKGGRKSLSSDAAMDTSSNVVFEVDLNAALGEMFNCKRQNIQPRTPRCIKRLLPDPATSPDTPKYIGQHNQGIGGIYADSYVPSSSRRLIR